MRREKFSFANNLRAGNAQALGGAWWLLRHFTEKRFAVLRLCLAASFDAVRLLAKQARER